MKSLVSRLERPQNACVRFFTPPQSTPTEVDLLHTAIRKQMAWKAEEQQSMWTCHAVNPARLLHRPLPACLPAANTPNPEYLQPIRTRRLIRTRKAQIRGVWNSIRPRNRYRPAASASAPAFALSWEIGRFTILICRYLRDQDPEQGPQQNPHSRRRIYLPFSFSHISDFRIYLSTPTASALELPAPTVARLIPEPQSTNPFAMPTGRRSGLFASGRSLKKTRK